MKNFIKDVLSEKGIPSTKRVAFFLLLLVFVAVIFVNLVWGKMLNEVLGSQLYYMLNALLIAIIGSNILDTVKEVKTVQSNNNATVGAASPNQPPPPPADVNVIK
jgi:Na+/glutamate symporter